MADSLTGTLPAVATSRRRRRGRDRFVPVAMLAPITVVSAVVIGFPILFVIAESFFDVNPSRHAGWEFAGLENYFAIAQDAEIGPVLLNSAVWTFGSVALQFVLAFAAALVVREALQGRAWAWLRAAYIIPWATPIIVGAMAWRWLYQPQFGLVNSVLQQIGLGDFAHAWLSDPATALGAVMVTNVWRGFPFIMVMLLSGMAAIPEEVYEAAKVDGAGAMQRVFWITLPMLRPVILLSTLMSLIWTFNNFGLIYVMTGGGPDGASDILTTFVYKNAFERFDFGYASALSVFLFVIVSAGSLLYVRALGKDALK
ncbi:sugar ABC transporter permease [Herbiconiux sp. VKM Ac-1786]|jgi:multiple sugar transport system permease protein|uniref:carbohydrate ABC transporter permease n=1 Tax=Herbiconiux sp. VKM Ac-1786 TaxID=2783824 RepID=UPI001889CE07|nr:sugar ABC transporter permease [Herbiconiux sp. VKM Ac-1786]MBF4571809.1 sugar ABC transporter permease [Herbiconiux sp. VKM Ac-1786]